MAQVACALADHVVITSDNPRTEQPAAIIDEILAGVDAASRQAVTVEVDRRTAIVQAIAMAAPDDVVLLAGKGHEDYQIIGRQKHHFDDREEATAALKRWRGARSKA
jgi:UDP-N-acetylmuramoyl-L-alanyl-D-glutamate--2,6-diaminopimelate ligase